ncbi:MAG: M48 family metallopeptidase [Maricaulaceae bacterium]|nr:M48 family metallopeptidase [Maricaulaceae bacterium]
MTIRRPRLILDRRELVIGLAAGTIVPFVSSCAENPSLGRTQMMLVSDAQIQQLSAQAWQDTLRQRRVLRDPPYQRRVDRVGQRIVQSTGMTHLDWEFVVFDSDTVNAFVLPNGKVGFYKGILDIMDNDDHIATVMGHEAGHVAGRHAAERASQQMAANLGLQVISAGLADVQYNRQIAGALGAGVTFGVILPYSRQHEYEADRLGLDYMARAGYSTQEAMDFWIAMSMTHQHRTAEFMSTHPSDESRIAAMRQHIRARGYA